MTNTAATAARIAATINALPAATARAFVQPCCGTLRLRTRSCATARIAIGRALAVLGVAEHEAGGDFQVLITGDPTVRTYPLNFDPMRPGIDAQTGAYTASPCTVCCD